MGRRGKLSRRSSLQSGLSEANYAWRYFARDAENGQSIALDSDVDPGEVKKA